DVHPAIAAGHGASANLWNHWRLRRSERPRHVAQRSGVQADAGRLPGEKDLASQPTLSRFENAVTIADLWQLRDEFAERFIQSFNDPPLRTSLDWYPFDDPAHGRQQLIMFHGSYDQYQYLPIITISRSFPARQPRRARRASRTERLNRALYRAIQNPTSPRIS